MRILPKLLLQAFFFEVLLQVLLLQDFFIEVLLQVLLLQDCLFEILLHVCTGGLYSRPVQSSCYRPVQKACTGSYMYNGPVTKNLYSPSVHNYYYRVFLQ